MKTIITTFTIIIVLIASTLYFGDYHFKKTSSDVLIAFFDALLETTPDTQYEIFDNDKDEKVAIKSYIKDHYSSIATPQMMSDLYNNGYIIQMINYATERNAHVKFDSLEIISLEESDGKECYNITGLSKVISLETNQETNYPFTGKIVLIEEDGHLKVDAFTFFTNDLLN